jgi:hypothetical protein
MDPTPALCALPRGLREALRGWLPPRGAVRPWGRLRPRGALHWTSCVLLWAVMLAYLGLWLGAERANLFDPLLQNNDARTSLFPFHRYGAEGALRDDAIAAEMMVTSTPGHWLLYRMLVPLVGLYFASKVVQLLCLAIIAAAAIVLLRARRAGLASALLLVFFLLHTPYVVSRIAGGHHRAFTFPLLALWTAGAIARRPRVRFAATLAGALIYPVALLLLLAAEVAHVLGPVIWRLRGTSPWRHRRGVLRPSLVAPLKPCALLVVLCTACAVVQAVGTAGYGRLTSLAEARGDPVFVHPREVLPFPAPLPVAALHLAHPFDGNGRSLFPGAADVYGHFGPAAGLVVAAVLCALAVARRAPVPAAALSLAASAAATYAAARLVALHLYLPVRYLQFGATGSVLALAVSSLGLLWPAARDRCGRAARRNLVAAGVVLLLWSVSGDGILRAGEPAHDGAVAHNGWDLDERSEGPLYAFIRTLAPDARIAMHPGDGAGISYWTARATTEHHETFQPWLVEPWQRMRARTQDTLRALYATDPRVLLEYCDRYRITHLLVHWMRYSPDFREYARRCPPFESLVDDMLSGIDRLDLVVPQVTGLSIVYYRPPWIVLDVERIRQALGTGEAAAADTP